MKTITMPGVGGGISQVALGIMRMGNLAQPKCDQALQTALASGINFFDAADIYGRDPELGRGSSEVHFGQALRHVGVEREQIWLQSKGGIFADEFDHLTRYEASQQHLIAAVEGSLRRLHVDYLDFFLIHRLDPLVEPTQVAAAFDVLQTSGKVRHFGVSNCNPRQIELLQAAVDQPLLVDQLQFGLGHTQMIDDGLNVNTELAATTDGLLEYLRTKRLTLQTWSPFQYGTFAGTFIDQPDFGPLNAVLARLAAKYQVTKNAIALAWILRLPMPAQVLIGTMTPAHITASAAGSEVTLTRQEWYDLYLAAGHRLP
ncbi:aldo/keto reductase [Limosilactobacillus ingluviei]